MSISGKSEPRTVGIKHRSYGFEPLFRNSSFRCLWLAFSRHHWDLIWPLPVHIHFKPHFEFHCLQSSGKDRCEWLIPFPFRLPLSSFPLSPPLTFCPSPLSPFLFLRFQSSMVFRNHIRMRITRVSDRRKCWNVSISISVPEHQTIRRCRIALSRGHHLQSERVPVSSIF